MLGVAK